MKSAFYSRNQSFSRSFRAEVAEEEGRLPRSRAAKELGLSVAAFDAGCAAVAYRPTEWHHVGKYANQVDYYDLPALAAQPEFWLAAAATYKSARKRAELAARPAQIAEEERQSRIAEFRQRLIRQRDCSRFIARRDTSLNWQKLCARLGATAPKGDFAALAASAEKNRNRIAAAARLKAWLAAKGFEPREDQFGRAGFARAQVRVMLIESERFANIYAGDQTRFSLPVNAALELLEQLHA